MTRRDIANDVWIARVRTLLAEGYGVEDIALKLRCDPDAVRNEIRILRASGELEEIVRWKA